MLFVAVRSLGGSGGRSSSLTPKERAVTVRDDSAGSKYCRTAKAEFGSTLGPGGVRSESRTPVFFARACPCPSHGLRRNHWRLRIPPILEPCGSWKKYGARVHGNVQIPCRTKSPAPLSYSTTKERRQRCSVRLRGGRWILRLISRLEQTQLVLL